MKAIPDWAERLAKDLDVIADGLEWHNQGENFDAETKGYIASHRVCAEHIRAGAKRVQRK